jgi:hypothetical protein
MDSATTTEKEMTAEKETTTENESIAEKESTTMQYGLASNLQVLIKTRKVRDQLDRVIYQSTNW